MIELKWHAHKVMVEVNSTMKDVSKKVANNVMKDAKQILRQKAKTKSESSLLDQFSVVKSKYKDGGYLVYCQGPKKWWPPYHASFVELGAYSSVYGTYKRPKGGGSLKGISPIYIKPKPFLRPAYKKNKRKADKMFQDALDKL